MRAHYCWKEVTSVAEALDAASSPGPFELPGVIPTHLPSRPFLLQHLHLEGALDPNHPVFTAVATITGTVIRENLHQITLDCRALDIDTVWLHGQEQPIAFDHDGEHLVIGLPQAASRLDVVTLSVKYRVDEPAMGLYFVGPTEAAPSRLPHIWSQNQDDDAPFWIPCIEDPGMKFTTSASITVPEGLTALSNGVLASSEKTLDGAVVWRWQQTTPIPVYLFAVVVGPFIETRDESEGVEIVWYCLPGREESARRAFGKTRQMVDFFEEFLGVPYPYARYAQVAVSEFVFGGMENATLTVITERALPSARAYPEYTADGLVAHELAHQWFGDLVTCREWAHAWLNEGFATYMDMVFREHDLGRDEFHFAMLRLARGYYAEAARYQRPLVSRLYEAPLDLFDRHLYHKGAWVLHMLRARLGDDAFRRALRIYLTRFSHNQAETHDFRRAVEDATGERLTAFFECWVWSAGHPNIKWRTRKDGSDLVISAKTDERWNLDIPAQALLPNGEKVQCVVRTRNGYGEGRLRNAALATYACLDSDYSVLGRFTPELPVKQLERVLKGAGVSVSRKVDMAVALGKKRTAASVRVLSECLRSDAFWGLRAETARALGVSGSVDAVQALVDMAALETHPKVRCAILQALGTCRGSTSAAAVLQGIAESGDPSVFVESAAIRGVGKLGTTGASGILTEALNRESFNDMVKVAALSGLGELGDTDSVEHLVRYTNSDQTTLVRAGAVRALAEIARHRPEVRHRIWDVYCALIAEPSQALRFSLVSAAGRIDDLQSVGFLNRIAEIEYDGLLRRRARAAARALTNRKESSGATAELRKTVDAMVEQHRKVDARLSRLTAEIDTSR
ncbi:MAG: M1 family aminopeptidase [Myxococcota bacterium]|nr:M1 family aminopeptidase [Myxococcota bacterium]